MAISIIFIAKLLILALITIMMAGIFLWPVNDKRAGIFQFFLYIVAEMLVIDKIFIGYISFEV